MDGMRERDLWRDIGSFAALGDSFTEGLNDLPPGGGYAGWADRVAGAMAERVPGFRYANLAVRGRLLDEVIAEQVPRAIELAPDLVSVAAGGNDILRGADVDTLASHFEPAVARLQAAGCRVFIFTGFDPRIFPVIRLLRGRIAAYNMHLRAIADDHDCELVDLWSMRVLRDSRAWSLDRLHLSSEGHRKVALRTCEVLGIPATEDWRAPLPPAPGAARGANGAGRDANSPARGANGAGRCANSPARGANGAGRGANGAARGADGALWLAARRQDARWARQYAMPWVRRRLRGTSTGDGLDPKRPDLIPIEPAKITR